MDEKQLEIPEELWRAMQSCEIFCVSACCGPDAYDFQPEHMRHWVQSVGDETVDLALRQLDHLADQAKAHDGPLELQFIADLATPAQVLDWLAEIRACLVECPRSSGNNAG